MIGFKAFHEAQLKCTEKDGCGYCKTCAKNERLKINPAKSKMRKGDIKARKKQAGKARVRGKDE